MDATSRLSTTTTLRIDSRLNPGALRSVFARCGRLHVPGFLESASARQLHGALLDARVPWQMHYNAGEDVFDIPATQVDALPPLERAALRRPIEMRARDQFQYCFDNCSLADHYARGEHLDLPAMAAYHLMQSAPVIEFARRVTGLGAISTADAQATRYRAGDFLTAHDDRDEVKGRLAAYVLNLTPGWRTDWGGLLQFVDHDGHVAEAYVPAYNALNIFRVPQVHCVSYVTPFAPLPRLSITGWFRQ